MTAATASAPQPTLVLGEDGTDLTFTCEALHGRRAVPPGTAPWAGWSARYQAAVGASDEARALLALGEDMGAWLDGDQGWLGALCQVTGTPILLELAIEYVIDGQRRRGSKPTEAQRAFLEAPWELLARAGRHLAADEGIALGPYRRLGAAAPATPSRYRLGLTFMAAAPDGVSDLFYEAEEVAILEATGDIGLDLVVEETGELAKLAECLTRTPADVLHLSCHGGLESPTDGPPTPCLYLETDAGAPAVTSAHAVDHAITGAQRPSLTFLSACLTAAPAQVGSLSLELVQRGWPALVGWAGSVGDAAATRFAKELYRQLAMKADLRAAMARARTRALTIGGDGGATKAAASAAPAAWHLGRLYVGPAGGGPLIAGHTPRQATSRQPGFRDFLDRKKEVPVAAHHEFVGRRRQVQQIIRAIRGQTHPGTAILGHGRHGKSSVAARVAHRVADTHQVVVVYEHYDAETILTRIAEYTDSGEVTQIVDRHRPLVRDRPAALREALRAVLTGPLSGTTPGSRPILLVLDDFERILSLPDRGQDTALVDLRRGGPGVSETVLALLQAFGKGGTRSHLLFTSRYRFAHPDHDNQDLAARLLEVSLPAMRPHESMKQLWASGATFPADRTHRPAACVERARGNPGLQSLLVTLAAASDDAWTATIAAMDAYLARGTPPAEGELLAFFQSLALDGLLGCVTAAQHGLLSALTMFRHPIPSGVIDELERALGVPGGTRRMVGLALIDALTAGAHELVIVNPLVRPRIKPCTLREARAIAYVALPPLLAAWRAEPEAGIAIECALAAIRCRDPEALAEVLQPALLSLASTHQARLAGRLASVALRLLPERPDEPGQAAWWRQVSDACRAIGRVDRAYVAILRAARCVDPSGPEWPRIRATEARLAAAQGKLDDALESYRQAAAAFENHGSLREAAAARGGVADILQARGDLDEALRIRREDELPVYDRLGDVRSSAMTMGQIADILQDRGDLDEALRIRREDELPVYDRLGDVRSSAITMGQIADILEARGDLDEALRIRREVCLPVYDRLGDIRERAVTMGKVADILDARGDLDEALRIRCEDELPVYDRLGDVRARAVTQGKVADILQARGDLDGALRIRREVQLPVYDRLGYVRERAVTMGKIADILQARGDHDEALRIRREDELPVYDRLGDVGARAITMGKIADILQIRGDLYEALRIRRDEVLPVFRQRSMVTEIAYVQWRLGTALLEAIRPDAALAHLREAFAIATHLRRPDAIVGIGQVYAVALASTGDRDGGLPVLVAVREAARTLGLDQLVAQLDDILGPAQRR